MGTGTRICWCARMLVYVLRCCFRSMAQWHCWFAINVIHTCTAAALCRSLTYSEFLAKTETTHLQLGHGCWWLYFRWPWGQRCGRRRRRVKVIVVYWWNSKHIWMELHQTLFKLIAKVSITTRRRRRKWFYRWTWVLIRQLSKDLT